MGCAVSWCSVTRTPRRVRTRPDACCAAGVDFQNKKTVYYMLVVFLMKSHETSRSNAANEDRARANATSIETQPGHTSRLRRLTIGARPSACAFLRGKHAPACASMEVPFVRDRPFRGIARSTTTVQHARRHATDARRPTYRGTRGGVPRAWTSKLPEGPTAAASYLVLFVNYTAGVQRLKGC